jgi:hypothetical protein
MQKLFYKLVSRIVSKGYQLPNDWYQETVRPIRIGKLFIQFKTLDCLVLDWKQAIVRVSFNGRGFGFGASLGTDAQQGVVIR